MRRTVTALAAATLASIAALLAWSADPRWAGHLVWDIRRYGRYASAFLAAGSWSAVPDVEYQPGALWLFVVPALLGPLGVPYELGMLLLQAVLVALHVPLLLRLGGPRAAWSGLGLFLAAGPIALYRFEPFVSLLVLGALAALRSNRLAATGAALGLAAAVKLYPLVLVPVFAVPIAARAGGRGIGRFALGVAIGGATPLVAYLVTGGTPGGVLAALSYHASKAVAVQSLLGTIVMIGAAAGGAAVPVHAHAMHGLAVAPGLRAAMNALAFAALAAAWAATWRSRHAADLAARLPIFVAAAVLPPAVLSTGFQPQYLLWPLAPVALLGAAAVRRTGAAAVALLALALAAMQIAFPVHYTELLAILYERRAAPLPMAASAVSITAATAVVALALREAFRGGPAELVPARRSPPRSARRARRSLRSRRSGSRNTSLVFDVLPS